MIGETSIRPNMTAILSVTAARAGDKIACIDSALRPRYRLQLIYTCNDRQNEISASAYCRPFSNLRLSKLALEAIVN
jgi:hypothetical protein